MKKSGLWQQLAELPAHVNAGIMAAVTEGKARPSAAELDRVGQAVDAVYSVDRLQSFSRARIASGIDRNRLAALDVWFDSVLGQKIRRLEEASAADHRDAGLKLEQGMALLQSHDAERRALINAFVQVTKSAEAFTNLAIDIALASQRVVSSIAPQGQALSPDELSAALEAQRPQMLQNYAVLSAASYAEAYASLPNQELVRYLAFLGSDAGSHYTDIGMRALSDCLVEATADLTRRLTGTQDRFRS